MDKGRHKDIIQQSASRYTTNNSGILPQRQKFVSNKTYSESAPIDISEIEKIDIETPDLPHPQLDPKIISKIILKTQETKQKLTQVQLENFSHDLDKKEDQVKDSTQALTDIKAEITQSIDSTTLRIQEILDDLNSTTSQVMNSDYFTKSKQDLQKEILTVKSSLQSLKTQREDLLNSEVLSQVEQDTKDIFQAFAQDLKELTQSIEKFQNHLNQEKAKCQRYHDREIQPLLEEEVTKLQDPPQAPNIDPPIFNKGDNGKTEEEIQSFIDESKIPHPKEYIGAEKMLDPSEFPENLKSNKALLEGTEDPDTFLLKIEEEQKQEIEAAELQSDHSEESKNSSQTIKTDQSRSVSKSEEENFGDVSEVSVEILQADINLSTASKTHEIKQENVSHNHHEESKQIFPPKYPREGIKEPREENILETTNLIKDAVSESASESYCPSSSYSRPRTDIGSSERSENLSNFEGGSYSSGDEDPTPDQIDPPRQPHQAVLPHSVANRMEESKSPHPSSLKNIDITEIINQQEDQIALFTDKINAIQHSLEDNKTPDIDFESFKEDLLTQLILEIYPASK